ncbi:hypothetical protein ADUPG1_014251, partial [Aduncisulcus paluster]
MMAEIIVNETLSWAESTLSHPKLSHILFGTEYVDQFHSSDSFLVLSSSSHHLPYLLCIISVISSIRILDPSFYFLTQLSNPHSYQDTALEFWCTIPGSSERQQDIMRGVHKQH